MPVLTSNLGWKSNNRRSYEMVASDPKDSPKFLVHEPSIVPSIIGVCPTGDFVRVKFEVRKSLSCNTQTHCNELELFHVAGMPPHAQLKIRGILSTDICKELYNAISIPRIYGNV